MREMWGIHAIHIIPYCHADPPILCKPPILIYNGRVVSLHQVTVFWHPTSNQDEEIARVYQITCFDGSHDEFPQLLRVENTVYVLTEWVQT